MTEDVNEARDEKPRSMRAKARRVLLGALLFIAAGTGLYWVSPWILPVYIVEGPMVQMATGAGVTLVWYTSRPTECEVSVTLDQAEQAVTVEHDGRRHRARITGLSPGIEYAYRILRGRRTLAKHQFQTNKTAERPYSFVVFGDSGKASRAQYILAARMTELEPDFLLHAGDLIYSRGERYHFAKRFFKPYRDMIRRVGFWPCLGNHDLAEPSLGAPYIEVFELPENGPPGQPPEHHYWYDYASARIAVIDSNVDEQTLRDAVAPWLHEVMSSTTALWKFVSLHHPPYTGGAYKPYERVQNTLVPVFEQTGVDIAFAAHDHNYQRTLPILAGQVVEPGQGVVYIVSGAGGAPLYPALPPDQRPEYIAAVNDETHSFTHVSIDAAVLVLRQIELSGAVIDEWQMRKDAPLPLSP